jgi:very-short-patch-repair endonuclease
VTAPKSRLEELLAIELRANGVPEPVREHRFHDSRRWRFDFAWPEHRLAVEVEGGTYVGGRHTRPAGFAADCAKYNTAAALGWRVLRYTGGRVRSGVAAREIAKALEGARHV